MAEFTAFHAKYFAHDLSRRATDSLDRFSGSLFDSAVDLNPHQIEAALFALQSPLSKGVMLADEVGLGKTIEAGIVLCQLWAERKRHLLVLCPATLRKQWQSELSEKFHLPSTILDSKIYKAFQKTDHMPLKQAAIVIMSFNFAAKIHDDLKAMSWDMVVIDEAHKLRNAYRPGNKVGQAIRSATQDARKLLLTATPLQNSLLELYGLSTLIDEHHFGDVDSFKAQYGGAGSDLQALRQRLSGFCRRTLRKDVVEYINYTNRKALTRPFEPTDDEQALYDAVSEFLRREDSYALPKKQRHLTTLILRKLLASSSLAIGATLRTLLERLEKIRDEKAVDDDDFVEKLVEEEELEDEIFDEISSYGEPEPAPEKPKTGIDRKRLNDEIETIKTLALWASEIGVDTKSKALLTALEAGFERMSTLGAKQKALIFTESRRTQDYLAAFLEKNGYAGKVVLFNGSNNTPETTKIYKNWLARRKLAGEPTSSRAVDIRTALIEHFRDEATILIATEAASEGVNLQFCSLVVNYDLPWNPQRVEQRIGRCHRYGQKHDVVVVNFVNERNAADKRVLELLAQKFSLFDGVFGASDEILGTIESSVNFETKILEIYQTCRTVAEIDAAFEKLRTELDQEIQSRLGNTRKALIEHFDEDVHERLRLQLQDTEARLDRFGKRLWDVTQYVLRGHARFSVSERVFDLDEAPEEQIPLGRYHLRSVSQPRMATAEPQSTNLETGGLATTAQPEQHLYRLSHRLGEYVIRSAKTQPTPLVHLVFDVTHHGTRMHVVEKLKGKSGYLTLTILTVDAADRDEFLLFSGFADDGSTLDQETMEKLFTCEARTGTCEQVEPAVLARLAAESDRHVKGTLNRAAETHNKYVREMQERLYRWADDLELSAQKLLTDTRDKIKQLEREAMNTTTLEDKQRVSEEIKLLQAKKKKLRAEAFNKDDEIQEKRNAFLAELERRNAQTSSSESLFTIRWSVE